MRPCAHYASLSRRLYTPRNRLLIYAFIHAPRRQPRQRKGRACDIKSAIHSNSARRLHRSFNYLFMPFVYFAQSRAWPRTPRSREKSQRSLFLCLSPRSLPRFIFQSERIVLSYYVLPLASTIFVIIISTVHWEEKCLMNKKCLSSGYWQMYLLTRSSPCWRKIFFSQESTGIFF